MRGLSLLDMAKGGFVPRLKADVYILSLSLPMGRRGLNSIVISHARSMVAAPQGIYVQGWNAVFLPAYFLHWVLET